jgi:hypothetical protein
VLGRLVPHKRVEHAIEVVARLRDRHPGLHLDVVGSGWWEDQLRATAERLGVTDVVEFHGYVDEQAKHELVARARVHLCPSVKEGWGLVVSEAGMHEVPTVGYRSAGGLQESVVDGRSGILVDDLDGFIAAVDRLLGAESLRRRMGVAAAAHAASFGWSATAGGFAAALAGAVRTASATRTTRSSAAVAVLQDLDGRIVLHLDAAVRIHGGLDAGDGDHAEGGAPAEGDEHGDERLHSETRFREGRRRSATVDGPMMIHNTDIATVPSAHA